MGEVYRARDLRLGRDVAVKVLPTTFATDHGRLQRFEQEARATAALNDANIVAIYDAGTFDGQPYVVSELLEGETLRSALTAGPLTLRKAVGYAQQIARGMAAAHRRGIVHRDLKPENVFITRDGLVKILDFGLAKLTEAIEGLPSAMSTTAPGVVLGTVGYMAPEQARGETSDSRSDIFSFGAVLYEMLSGRARVPGQLVDRNAVGDSAGAARRSDARRSGPLAGAGAHRRPLPREGQGRSISDRVGPGICARRDFRLLDARCRVTPAITRELEARGEPSPWRRLPSPVRWPSALNCATRSSRSFIS